MKKEHINSLTGIRGIASLWVMLHHLIIQYPIKGSSPIWLQLIAEKGWLGVDIFFILSGTILSYVHQNDFHQEITLAKWKQFMISRFARIYPVHLLTTVTLIPIFLTATYFLHYQSPTNNFTLAKLLYSLSLTNGLGIPDSVGWNFPSWSVGSEIFAYLLFPFLTLFIFSRRISTLTCLASCISILTITTLVGWYFSNGQQYFPCWELNILRVTSEFIIGCFLFKIYQRNKKGKWWIGEASLISITLLIILNISNRWDVLFIVSFATLIFGLLEDRGITAQILGSRFFIYLGQISYSTYLCHGIVFMVLNSLFQKIFSEGSTRDIIIASVIYILATWSVSHFMYYKVEKKSRTYIKNRFLPT